MERDHQASIPPTIPLRITEDSYTTTSTCVLMPPRHLWGPFVEIKKHHMNPRIKRPPYPHITLLAPFLRKQLFPQATELLKKSLSNLSPFYLSFDTFRIFANGANQTLYLEPRQEPADSLQKLHQLIISTIPASQKQARAATEEIRFAPHIGVAFVREQTECEALKSKYQKDWKPLQFRVQEIYFLHRTSADAAWEVAAIVPLGGAASAAPHFQLGESTA